MKMRQTTPERPSIVQGKQIEAVFRRAVRHALLAHKRAGNTVAVYKDGRIVLVPAHEIKVDEAEVERG
jgi:hypothetical protein